MDADITGPIVNLLLFRTVISYDQDMHYWKPYDAHSYDISPSLLWQPIERASLSLKYERFFKDETPQLMQKPTYNTQNGIVPTAADPNLSNVEVPGLPDDWNSMSNAGFRRSETDGMNGWFAASGRDAAILAKDTSTLDAAGRANYKNVHRFHNAPLQMSAPHLANLWTRYNLTRSALKNAYVAGGINFVYDQTLLPDSPESSHQTYSLYNATAGYAWVWNDFHLNAEIFGKNLADEHYRPSQRTRGRPRELFLTVAVRI